MAAKFPLSEIDCYDMKMPLHATEDDDALSIVVVASQ
jgi:hypothetical protein